jgi:hypothetical protein
VIRRHIQGRWPDIIVLIARDRKEDKTNVSKDISCEKLWQVFSCLRQALYNLLIDFGISVRLVRLIKICL